MNYTLKIYNTLHHKIEDFKPLKDNEVRIYSCGPTVYDFAHIGNFRSYIFADLLRRTLKLLGYKVIHVMNITDVDDKTIKNANKNNVSLKEYTDKYIKEFFKDLELLNIEKVEHYPRATEHIDEMIALIEKLEKNGLIYSSEGSIYYKISNFKEYGKLSGVDLSQNIDGYRINSDEYDKDNVKDFVLWKAKKENEPYWSTKYGDGRPGWHIECSAMSMKYLGETFDIHTGGNDLIFPHHENEIAQSEGATGKQFVRYWMHCAHLIVNGEKMSKSKGNFFTLRELIEKGYSPKSIRFLLLTTHYRKKLNFTFDGLKQADAAIERYQNFYDSIKEKEITDNDDTDINKILTDAKNNFLYSLADDLNISGATGVVFDFIKTINKSYQDKKISPENKEKILNLFEFFDKIYNILEKEKKEIIDEEIKKLIEERQKARAEKNWALADKIRDELRQKGIILEDTKEGVKWRIISE